MMAKRAHASQRQAQPTRESICRRLREAREAAGLSQAELGARIGLSQANVSQYESGGRMPGAILLWRWAQALGAPLDALVGP